MSYIEYKNNRLNIFFKIFAFFVVAITFSLALISCSNTETIELADYFSFEGESGLDGYGSIEYSFNADKLCEDVLGKVPTNKNIKDYESRVEEYENLCEELQRCVVIHEDESNGSLSNGDTVSFEIEFKSENSKYDFDKNILGSTVSKSIEGLEEPEVIDVFDSKYFTISFYGIDGYGKMEHEGYWNIEWQRGITYTFSKESNFCNGDIVTVTAELDAASYEGYLEDLMSLGYIIPQKSSAEFEVTGLKRLASSEDITDDVIEQAKENAMTYFNSHTNDEGDCFDVNIVGVYFKDKNDKTTPYDNSWWDGLKYYTTLNVIISYKHPVFSTHVERTTSIIFTDITLDEEGNILALPSPEDEDSVSYCCTEIDVMGAFFKDVDTYTVTKLQ